MQKLDLNKILTLFAEISEQKLKDLLDELAFTQDNRYQHYLQKTPRIEIRQDILARKYYNDMRQVSDYQMLLPKQLLPTSIARTQCKSPRNNKKLCKKHDEKFLFLFRKIQ